MLSLRDPEASGAKNPVWAFRNAAVPRLMTRSLLVSSALAGKLARVLHIRSWLAPRYRTAFLWNVAYSLGLKK